MPKRPEVALFVPDLATDLKFYVERLNFTLGEYHPAVDVAQIIYTNGESLLLAGLRAGNVSPYLTKHHFTIKPGNTLNFPHADLDTLSATLQNGQEPVQIIEKRWGEPSLDVHCPIGGSSASCAYAYSPNCLVYP